MQKTTMFPIISRLVSALRANRSRNVYHATISFGGLIYTVEVEAQDYASAQQETERILDDCGFLLNLTQA